MACTSGPHLSVSLALHPCQGLPSPGLFLLVLRGELQCPLLQVVFPRHDAEVILLPCTGGPLNPLPDPPSSLVPLLCAPKGWGALRPSDFQEGLIDKEPQEEIRVGGEEAGAFTPLVPLPPTAAFLQGWLCPGLGVQLLSHGPAPPASLSPVPVTTLLTLSTLFWGFLPVCPPFINRLLVTLSSNT